MGLLQSLAARVLVIASIGVRRSLCLVLGLMLGVQSAHAIPFETFIDVDDEGDGLAGEDVIPEPPLNPVSRSGDLWLLGEHRQGRIDGFHHR